MKTDQKRYGLEGWEQLETELPDVVQRIIDDTWCEPGQDVMGKIKWPIRILVFRPVEIQTAEHLGRIALEAILERLDDEFGDPGGNPTEPTDTMIQAALALGEAVRANYVPWDCELTGEVIELTRAAAAAMVAGGRGLVGERSIDRIAPYGHEVRQYWTDKKGGDPAEWPEDLRVREWPGGGR